jgi:ubiquitin-protein ligase
MGSAAIRRLMAEYKQLLHNPPDGVIAGPVNQVKNKIQNSYKKVYFKNFAL